MAGTAAAETLEAETVEAVVVSGSPRAAGNDGPMAVVSSGPAVQLNGALSLAAVVAAEIRAQGPNREQDKRDGAQGASDSNPTRAKRKPVNSRLNGGQSHGSHPRAQQS